MSTKFTLGPSGETVPISPTPDAGWEDTSQFFRALCKKQQRSLGSLQSDFIDLDNTNKDILFAQFISDKLSAGQIITGSQIISAQCLVSETDPKNNMFFTIGIRVIAANGITIQKTILNVNRGVTEADPFAIVNRSIFVNASATNYTTVSGDRLVIEMGMGGDPNNVGGVHDSIMIFGDVGSPLPQDESSTSGYPWVQLTDTISFQGTIINDSLNLFIYGIDNINDSCNLFIRGHESAVYNNSTLYIAFDYIGLIQKCDLDGNNLIPVMSGLPAISGGSDSINVDNLNDKLYWIQEPSIDLLMRRSNLNGTNIENITSGNIFPMKLDPFNDRIFGINIGYTINIRDLNGQNNIIVYSGSLAINPYAIDFDPIDQKIYWTDIFTFHKAIVRSNYDGSNAENVIFEGDDPLGIVIDRENRKIYWGLLSGPSDPTLLRSNIDGSNIETIIPSGFSSLRSLVMDYLNRRIYVLDTVQRNIIRVGLDNNLLEILPFSFKTDGTEDPISITIDQRVYKSLFIYGNGKQNNSINLFVHGFQNINNSCNLFITGYKTIVASVANLYYSTFAANEIRKSDINGIYTEVVTSGLPAISGYAEAIDIDRLNNRTYFLDNLSNNAAIRSISLFNALDYNTLISSPNIDYVRGFKIFEPSGLMYWVDISNESPFGYGEISRANLDGSNQQLIIAESGLVPFDVDFDLVNQKLYWTANKSFTASGLLQIWSIRRSNLDGSNIEIVNSGIQFRGYSSIVVDSINGKVYWGVVSELFPDESTIYSVELDGANLVTIIPSGYKAPNDMSIHVAEEKLYWCETLNPVRGIYRCNLDGSNIEQLPINLTVIVDGQLATDLPLSVKIDQRDYRTLFIDGFAIQNNNINLFVHGHIKLSNIANDLFIFGKESRTENIDIFINGYIEYNDNINLFIGGFIPINNNVDLFINGLILITDSIDLLIRVKEVNDIDLFIKGVRSPIILPCPILDPIASIQISDDLIQIYQSRIDALINQLGKNVLLEFDPIKEPCSNCIFDIVGNRSIGIYKIGGPIPFAGGQKCSFCKGIGFLEQQVNKCIKALIQWNPKDAQKYGISVDNPFNIVRFKGFLTDGPDMVRARSAISNHDIEDVMKLRVKLIKGPIIVGLRESRYIISFWKLLDN